MPAASSPATSETLFTLLPGYVSRPGPSPVKGAATDVAPVSAAAVHSLERRSEQLRGAQAAAWPPAAVEEAERQRHDAGGSFLGPASAQRAHARGPSSQQAVSAHEPPAAAANSFFLSTSVKQEGSTHGPPAAAMNAEEALWRELSEELRTVPEIPSAAAATGALAESSRRRGTAGAAKRPTDARAQPVRAAAKRARATPLADPGQSHLLDPSRKFTTKVRLLRSS
jgi:hypothetical protein